MAKSKHEVERPKFSLDLDESIELHEASWKFQKIGWIFIYGIVVCAAIGLFGNGVFSKKTIQQSGVNLEFDKFLRHEAEFPIKLRSQGNTKLNTVEIPQEYLRNFKVENIVPEPTETSIEGENVVFAFDTAHNQSAVFYLVPKQRGNIGGDWKVNNTVFPLSHFIYP
jgi:hypothetical protein